MQKNVLNGFVISIMFLWRTTTVIMGTLQTRLLLMMLSRGVRQLCCLCIFLEQEGRKGNLRCARYGMNNVVAFQSKWIDAVHLSLWSYAMRMAICIMNYLADEANGSSHIKKFSQVELQVKMQPFHIFRCPVYALTPEAENAMAKRLDARSRIGLY